MSKDENKKPDVDQGIPVPNGNDVDTGNNGQQDEAKKEKKGLFGTVFGGVKNAAVGAKNAVKGVMQRHPFATAVGSSIVGGTLVLVGTGLYKSLTGGCAPVEIGMPELTEGANEDAIETEFVPEVKEQPVMDE